MPKVQPASNKMNHLGIVSWKSDEGVLHAHVLKGYTEYDVETVRDMYLERSGVKSESANYQYFGIESQ